MSGQHNKAAGVYKIKKAESLEVGDVVRVWWGRGCATVSGFKSHPQGEGWRIAEFGDGYLMTITPLMLLAVRDNADG